MQVSAFQEQKGSKSLESCGRPDKGSDFSSGREAISLFKLLLSDLVDA